MKRGQVVITIIFVFLVIVLVGAFYFYYSDSSITGDVVETKKVRLVERESLADNLLVPQNINVNAVVGETTQEEFEVVNYNDQVVSVSCSFPPFQANVPSSRCFTYNSEGGFVGSDEGVNLSPGQRHVFVASVRPFDNIEVKNPQGDEVLVTIYEGEYSGNVELRAWPRDDASKVSVVSVPVKISVEE